MFITSWYSCMFHNWSASNYPFICAFRGTANLKWGGLVGYFVLMAMALIAVVEEREDNKYPFSNTAATDSHYYRDLINRCIASIDYLTLLIDGTVTSHRQTCQFLSYITHSFIWHQISRSYVYWSFIYSCTCELIY